MTAAYTAAIKEAQSHVGAAWRDSYATFGPGGMETLSCSCCGNLIGKLIPHDQPVIRRQGQQTFITERMVFAYLSNYREVLLQMNDGNKHVTNVCVDCVPRLQTNQFSLAALYAMDLSQWSSEGVILDDATCNRRPEAILAVDNYIKE